MFIKHIIIKIKDNFLCSSNKFNKYVVTLRAINYLKYSLKKITTRYVKRLWRFRFSKIALLILLKVYDLKVHVSRKKMKKSKGKH